MFRAENQLPDPKKIYDRLRSEMLKPKTSVPRRRGEVQNKDCVENANLCFELSRVINARIILASVPHVLYFVSQ